MTCAARWAICRRPRGNLYVFRVITTTCRSWKQQLPINSHACLRRGAIHVNHDRRLGSMYLHVYKAVLHHSGNAREVRCITYFSVPSICCNRAATRLISTLQRILLSTVTGRGRSETPRTSSAAAAANVDSRAQADDAAGRGASTPGQPTSSSSSSSASRRFRLLTSIPRAIFSLERRTFGSHSTSSASPTAATRRRDDSAQAHCAAADGVAAKSNRLLASLGLSDDSSLT
jgi:hypothetical protein